MIDTIKLSIHAPYGYDEKGNFVRIHNRMFYDILLTNCNQRMNGFILNSRTGVYQTDTMFQMKKTQYENYELMVLNGSMKTPSYSYNIHYRIFDERIEMEFSLPKYFYGTNIFELRSHSNKANPVQLYDALLLSLKSFFEEMFFNVRIDWGAIEILRWDFCYNQVFNTKKESLEALKYIKLKHQSKGDRMSFETGFVQLTKTNYLKIYHKGEEFIKHDMYKLESKHIEKYAEISQRILRYEKKCTQKNVAYFWNCNFRNYGRHDMKEEYLKQKKNGKVDKHLRSEFENVQRFTIGNALIDGATKLEPLFFTMLYDKFRKEIKQKFSIGKLAVDPLMKEVVQPTKNRTTKIRILALIKTFKSLKRAWESGAISEATYYRYKKIQENEGMSETNIKTDIYQCWDSDRYNRLVFNSGINPSILAKKIWL
jgi:hypothetical protein